LHAGLAGLVQSFAVLQDVHPAGAAPFTPGLASK
jgi:hypothetical protein